jgi:hypothetical protein
MAGRADTCDGALAACDKNLNTFGFSRRRFKEGDYGE